MSSDGDIIRIGFDAWVLVDYLTKSIHMVNHRQQPMNYEQADKLRAGLEVALRMMDDDRRRHDAAYLPPEEIRGVMGNL